MLQIGYLDLEVPLSKIRRGMKDTNNTAGELQIRGKEYIPKLQYKSSRKSANYKKMARQARPTTLRSPYSSSARSV